MSGVLIALVTVGLAAALVSLVVPVSVGRVVSVVAGLACFGLALVLVPAAANRTVGTGFLRADALSGVFVLTVGFLYAATTVYTVGYLRAQAHEDGHRCRTRLLWCGLNLFCWAMLAAPLMSGLALLWIAIEVTTVVSALLVAIDDTDGAAEASWKYLLIASAGLGVALFATIIIYYAGARVLGEGLGLGIGQLIHAGLALPAGAVRLSFVLATLGFGTKMGLVPVHTWLPDAHAEAPAPASTLLSGGLLAVSFYAILRYYQITSAAVGASFGRTVLLAFGIASLLLAALVLLDQHDIKRLLAYSSVEHMGILAMAIGFGAPIAAAGAMLHVLAHAAAKSCAFFGAGTMSALYRTRDIGRIRATLDRLPLTAPMFLLAVLALSALPPFGIFRSEFMIVAGGLASPSKAPAAILVLLTTLAFLGLSFVTTRMSFESGTDAHASAAHGLGPGAMRARREPSVWLVAPMVAGLIALLVLGIHPPGPLQQLLHQAAAELGARP
ncbi:MAG TPA: proton-conducting transporter membrane subunit [Nocardioidaceae bacterium]|nr:proton-conducting transporter membrane subunit [Nocardioidaceae bacterium]